MSTIALTLSSLTPSISPRDAVQALIRRLYGRAQSLKSTNGRLASSRSKTGDPKCSAAASKLALRKATSEDQVQLARCRAMSKGQRAAVLQRAAGHEAKARHLEHRAKSGAEGGAVTGPERKARAVERVAERVKRNEGRGVPVVSPSSGSPSAEPTTKPAHEKSVKERIERLSRIAEKSETHHGKMIDRLARKGNTDEIRPAISLRDRQLVAQRKRINVRIGEEAEKLGWTDPSKSAPASVTQEEEEAAPPTSTASTPAGPSLREQAAMHRAAKGKRSQRLEALAERAKQVASDRSSAHWDTIRSEDEKIYDLRDKAKRSRKPENREKLEAEAQAIYDQAFPRVSDLSNREDKAKALANRAREEATTARGTDRGFTPEEAKKRHEEGWMLRELRRPGSKVVGEIAGWRPDLVERIRAHRISLNQRIATKEATRKAEAQAAEKRQQTQGYRATARENLPATLAERLQERTEKREAKGFTAEGKREAPLTPEHKAAIRSLIGRAQARQQHAMARAINRENREEDRFDQSRRGVEVPARESHFSNAAEIRKIRAKFHALPEIQDRIAEQSARADIKHHRRFPLFGNQTPDERPYESERPAPRKAPGRGTKDRAEQAGYYQSQREAAARFHAIPEDDRRPTKAAREAAQAYIQRAENRTAHVYKTLEKTNAGIRGSGKHPSDIGTHYRAKAEGLRERGASHPTPTNRDLVQVAREAKEQLEKRAATLMRDYGQHGGSRPGKAHYIHYSQYSRPLIHLTRTATGLIRLQYARTSGNAAPLQATPEACSKAASQWRRKEANTDTHRQLAACRAAKRGSGQAAAQRNAGQEGRAQHLEHRAKSGQLQTATARKAEAKRIKRLSPEERQAEREKAAAGKDRPERAKARAAKTADTATPAAPPPSGSPEPDARPAEIESTPLVTTPEERKQQAIRDNVPQLKGAEPFQSGEDDGHKYWYHVRKSGKNKYYSYDQGKTWQFNVQSAYENARDAGQLHRVGGSNISSAAPAESSEKVAQREEGAANAAGAEKPLADVATAPTESTPSTSTAPTPRIIKLRKAPPSAEGAAAKTAINDAMAAREHMNWVHREYGFGSNELHAAEQNFIAKRKLAGRAMKAAGIPMQGKANRPSFEGARFPESGEGLRGDAAPAMASAKVTQQGQGAAPALAPTAAPRGRKDVLRDLRAAEREAGGMGPGNAKWEAVQQRIKDLNKEHRILLRGGVLPVPAPTPKPAEPTGFDPSKSYAVNGKEPWQMTGKEWGQEFDRHAPATLGGVGRESTQKRGGGDTMRRIEHESRMKMDLPDVQDPDGILSPFGARHREVVEAAVAAGKSVPAHVMAEYPNLAPAPIKLPPVSPAMSEPSGAALKPSPTDSTRPADSANLGNGKTDEQVSNAIAIKYKVKAELALKAAHAVFGADHPATAAARSKLQEARARVRETERDDFRVAKPTESAASTPTPAAKPSLSGSPSTARIAPQPAPIPTRDPLPQLAPFSQPPSPHAATIAHMKGHPAVSGVSPWEGPTGTRHYLNLEGSRRSFRGDQTTKLWVHPHGHLVYEPGKGTRSPEFEESLQAALSHAKVHGISVQRANR